MNKIINASEVEVRYDSKNKIKNGPFKGYNIVFDHDRRIYNISKDFPDFRVEFSCKPMQGQLVVSQQALAEAYMLKTLEDDTKIIENVAKNNLSFDEQVRNFFYLTPYELATNEEYMTTMVELMKKNVNDLIEQNKFEDYVPKNLRDAYSSYRADTLGWHVRTSKQDAEVDAIKL